MIIFAFDFGGSKLTAAALETGQNNWLAHQRVVSPPDADGRDQFNLMIELANNLITDTGHHPNVIGVSFGGPVETDSGLVRTSYHIPEWDEVPLAAWFQTELAAPTVIENDANAAALGEFRYGAGQGCQSLLYVTVSTGVGGGWIVDGQIYRGFQGLAGEIGHLVVEQDGMLCPCGQQGCLQAEASGISIAHRARLWLARRKRQGKELRKLVDQDLDNITAELVSQAAAAGDSVSQTVLKIAGEQLGRGLSNAITLLNPERVILGGGVTKAGELWWQTVHETTRKFTLDSIQVKIVPAELGDDAPLWGAAALAESLL